jgi:ribose-phosphate pyrophosphokinase
MNTRPPTTPPPKNLVLLASKFPKQIKDQLTHITTDLGYTMLPTNIGAFKSAERFCELYPQQQFLFAQNKAEIAGATVHVILGMPQKPDTLFFDAINTAETLKTYGAAHIHMIIPFAPFARQDRAFDKRFVSIAADTFPKHLKTAGVDYITTFDTHSVASENFYKKTFGDDCVNIMSARDLIHTTVNSLTTQHDIIKHDIIKHSIIKYGGPDGGDKPDDMAQTKARYMTRQTYGENCNIDDHMFFITKQHEGINKTKILSLKGDVKDVTAIIIDDMTDTGGTLVNAANSLKKQGAKRVIAAFTHAIVSGQSLHNLTSDTIDGQKNPIDHLIATDSIITLYAKTKKLTQQQQERITIIPTAPLIKHALMHKFQL